MIEWVADHIDAIRAVAWWSAFMFCAIGSLECFAMAVYEATRGRFDPPHRTAIGRLVRRARQRHR